MADESFDDGYEPEEVQEGGAEEVYEGYDEGGEEEEPIDEHQLQEELHKLIELNEHLSSVRQRLSIIYNSAAMHPQEHESQGSAKQEEDVLSRISNDSMRLAFPYPLTKDPSGFQRQYDSLPPEHRTRLVDRAIKALIGDNGDGISHGEHEEKVVDSRVPSNEKIPRSGMV